MDVFLWWFIFAVLVGVAAASRGRSGLGWWFLSMLLSPLIGIIMVAILPSLKPSPAAGASSGGAEAYKTRSCPFCAEPIRVEAIKCKHCGSAVEPASLNFRPTSSPH